MNLSNEYERDLEKALGEAVDELSALSEEEFENRLAEHSGGELGTLLLHAGAFEVENDDQYEFVVSERKSIRQAEFKMDISFPYAMAA